MGQVEKVSSPLTAATSDPTRLGLGPPRLDRSPYCGAPESGCRCPTSVCSGPFGRHPETLDPKSAASSTPGHDSAQTLPPDGKEEDSRDLGLRSAPILHKEKTPRPDWYAGD